MSEEEYMECSVVAYPRQIKFLHINGGAISYYVDRHVSDYVDRLQQENQEIKKQIEEYQKALDDTMSEKMDLEEDTQKYKEVIDKAIEQINDYKIYCENNKGFTEYTDIEIEAIEPVISKLEDILKEVSE